MRNKEAVSWDRGQGHMGRSGRVCWYCSGVGKVGKETIAAQQYVLLTLWSTDSQDSRNTDDDTAFDVQENKNEVHVSLSGSDKTKKHDEKAKRKAKGKSLVDPSNYLDDPDMPALEDIIYLDYEEDVGKVGKETDSQDSRNTDDDTAFDVQENKNEVHVSLSGSNKTKKHDEKAKREAKGKNLVDPSNYLDDPDMPALEDIIYLDYEEDVGAEADLSNLETNISVSPILTTRVYKDHLVTQIISDLTSAPQTRSMARMVKEQGGLN
nr:hypothetical protein [Tanacetum cinerariifolium]